MTQVEQYSYMSLEPAQLRALQILKKGGLMTAAQFATALLAEMPGTSTNECLEQLCRLGLAEPQIRTVGPVHYKVTSEGNVAAW